MVKVAIVGASGYTGAELIRIIANHPDADLKYLTANKYAYQKVADLYPHLAVCGDLVFSAYDLGEAKEADVVFVALPHGMSMEVIPDLLGSGCRIIDLSGDFRLKEEALYQEWYGFAHTHPDLLGKAVYGLPELHREEIKKAEFVANPGCYPTSAILALAPLLKGGHVSDEPVVVNSCSGVSGAGRALSLNTHFSECNESVEAYSVAAHKHTPEMEQEMSVLLKKQMTITFIPHLVPITRGILTTVCCDMKTGWQTSELIDLYEEFYKDDVFVNVMKEGIYPKTKHVLGSNYCFIGVKMDQRTGRAVVVTAIDNLVKGASGQAIQNMNLMCGLKEDTGLASIGLAP